MRADAVYKRSLVRVLKWVLSCSEIEKSLIEADSLAARGRERRRRHPRASNHQERAVAKGVRELIGPKVWTERDLAAQRAQGI